MDDIAFTFGASRSLLNVVRILSHAQFRKVVTITQCAAAKGLVTGYLTVLKADGVSVHNFNDPSGHLIPSIEGGDTIQTAAKLVLVVEKEASSALRSHTYH